MTATAIRPPTGRVPPPPGRLRRHPRLVCAALLLIAVLAGVAYTLLGTQLAAVRTVQVTGTREVPASAVLAAARVPVGTPMVRLDGAVIGARILARLANVGSVSVHRSWPSTVRLAVRERVVAVVVPHDGQFLLVDRTGVGYRLTKAAPAGAVTASLADPGPADESTRAALAVLAGLPRDLRALVQRIAAPTPDQVTLLLKDHRAVLWGGREDGRAKAAVVHILLHRKGQHIDVSAPHLVTVR